MTVPSGISTGRRKTRIVTFRVSEEDFQQLKRACATAGARSFSEFARMALRRLSAGPPAAQATARVLSIQEGWLKSATGAEN